MPSDAADNLRRLLITCASYRRRYDEWPSEARLHPVVLWDIASLLDHDEFAELATRLELRTQHGMGISVAGHGEVSSEDIEYPVDDDALRLTEKWLDVEVRQGSYRR